MHKVPFLHSRLFLMASAWAWLSAAGGGLALTMPPEDGILDETRALTPETHRLIAEELKQFRQVLKFEAWIRASSFMPAGVTVRRYAQTTRREWSGTRPAVLMAYDRATHSSAMSFGPMLWERYPAADLVEIMQDVRRTLADSKLTLDERFALATRIWTDRLRTLESIRLQQSLWLQRREKRFALTVPAILAGGAVVASLLGYLSRRRSACASRRFRLPEVQVGTRFGAACGGGVTAELKTHSGAH